MGKQKKNKDRKDKKKNKDRDRERKDKKKKDRRRSSSSSSSSSDGSSSSSSSREKSKRKQAKIKKKDKKEVKQEVKPTNNPYDFEKTVPKAMPGFPVGLPSPGFSVPTMHPTPPPPMVTTAPVTTKPKTKQIHIFKMLPKLPFGAVQFAKTLYSTQYIQPANYQKLLKKLIDQVDAKVKQDGGKKAGVIMVKYGYQVQKLAQFQEQQRKKSQLQIENNANQEIVPQEQIKLEQDNRFTALRKVYGSCFPVQL